MKKLSLHSKIVILSSTILVFGGAILMFIFEYNNPQTIGNMSIQDKLLNSFFASVSPRTAGFNSIPLTEMSIAGNFLTIILMFIGGSPGSTAGGLKTVTLSIIVLTIISVIKGREDTEVFGRRFSKKIVYKAFTIAFIGISLVIGVTMILSCTESNASFMQLLYEVVSGLGTVGLTLDLTPKLTIIGKILIMIMMYLGRVGILTVMFALTRKNDKRSYKYPEGKILIG